MSLDFKDQDAVRQEQEQEQQCGVYTKCPDCGYIGRNNCPTCDDVRPSDYEVE